MNVCISGIIFQFLSQDVCFFPGGGGWVGVGVLTRSVPEILATFRVFRRRFSSSECCLTRPFLLN